MNLSALIQLFGDKVKTDQVTLTAYSTDATPEFKSAPDAVVFAESTDDVVKLIKFANENKVPIITRGAGSNLAAATVPISGGIVLVMTKLNRILEISKSEMLAVVEPAVTNVNLDDAAAAYGLMYPPDPGSRTVSTIGGNIATCAGGLRGLKYGVTRNYVLGLEVVLGTGEVINTGSRMVKDVAGYDVTRLLVGSEGTLGVITKATVALRPRPTISKYGVAYFKTLADASVAVDNIVGAGILPATLEFLDNVCINAVEKFAQIGLDTSAGALLLFGEDGDSDDVEVKTQQMADICSATAGVISVTRAKTIVEADQLLFARRCALPALAREASLAVSEDICVPRPLLAETVAKIGEISKNRRVKVGVFGHAGDGNLHPKVLADINDPDEVARLHQALDDIFTLSLDMGGTITGEHGVGIAKLPYLERKVGKEQMELFRRIKTAFDPNGILNPGKTGS
ncbi:MAG: FAD-binding oxidoreductase [Candidatus Nanopelagicales bacterium]